MDSIVKQRNDGFKAGEFLHRTTQLLPWPENERLAYIYDATTAASYTFGSVASRTYPNVYDALGGYIDIHATGLRYYNKDGSIRWVLLRNDLPRNNVSFKGSVSIIHLIDGVPHFIGLVDENTSSYHRIVKVNLIDMTAVVSPTAYENTELISSFGILEDGTLYCTHLYSNNTRSASKLVDLNTLTKTDDIPEVGIVRQLRSNPTSTSTDKDFSGIALFNGSLSLIGSSIGSSSSGGYTYDICSILFGINPDLDMTTAKAGKTPLRTSHSFAVNMFSGGLTQVSKDLFMSDMQEQHGYFAMTNISNKYFTRQALEEWASNCLYETTGFRIPLSASKGT